MSTPPLQRYAFDTVFDGGGAVVSQAERSRRMYALPEVEAERAGAFAEGERSALVNAEANAAEALRGLTEIAGQALGALARVAHDHRTACADLALAVGRAIAGAALDRFPAAPVEATLAGLARELEAAPRLVVRCAPAMEAVLQERLSSAAQAHGFPGQILVRADLDGPPAAFVFDWGDGKAAFDPTAAAQRVAEVLEAALAAEGLHAEPLIPAREADHG